MQDQKPAKYCKNCESPLFGDYCSHCGQAKELKRINGQYIISEFASVFNFEKGILFTIRELLIRPGRNIRKFINEDRNRLVKPIVFIIVCSLVYTLVQQLLLFEDGYVNYSFDKNSAVISIFEWISTNYGYANILMAVFIAIWIKIFFRKFNYNFFEILILLCFLMGIGMLIFSIFGIADSLVDLKILDKGFLIGILYIAWGIARFFDKRKKVNYIKAIFCYMLGMFTFTFLAMMLGFLIDLLNK